jgi:hypothetical protein
MKKFNVKKDLNGFEMCEEFCLLQKFVSTSTFRGIWGCRLGFFLDKDGKLWLHPNLLSLCVMSFFIVRNTNNFIFE